jgi:hypothetical protein
MKDAIVKMFGKPVFVCGMSDHVVEFGSDGITIDKEIDG